MGAFDDLIPEKPAAAAAPAAAPSGTFDDLLPGAREKQLRKQYGEEINQRGEPGYTTRFIDSLTAGVIRPLSGATRVVGGLFDPTSTAGERWRAGVGAAEDYFRKGEENTAGPLGVATDVGGAVAGGVGGVGRAALGRLMARGAVGGAVEGASRNAEDLPSAVGGALVGGAVGGAAGGVGGAVANRFTGRAAREVGEASRGGTGAGLRAEAGDLFTQLENAGVHFSGQETTGLANRANAALANSAYSRNVPDNINGVMREINDRVGQGAMTYGDVRRIQTQLSTLRAHNDPTTRALAGDLSHAVDDFMNTARPTVPPGSQFSPDDLNRARDLYRRGSQADRVEGLATAGTRRAQDPTDRIQGNFERYSDQFVRNPRKFNPLREHMGAIDEIVEGSPGRERLADLLNTSSKYLAGGTVLGGGGAAGAALASDKFNPENLGTGALIGLGAAGGSKVMSNALRRQLATMNADQVNALLRHIITGQAAAPPATAGPRAALAQIAAGNAAAGGAGTYGGSFVEKKEKSPTRVIIDQPRG